MAFLWKLPGIRKSENLYNSLNRKTKKTLFEKATDTEIMEGYRQRWRDNKLLRDYRSLT